MVTKFVSFVTEVVEGAGGCVVVVVVDVDDVVEDVGVDEPGAALADAPESEHAAPEAIDVATNAMIANVRRVSGCSHA
jgi:hypothetical protein